jgi:hypothetical protein
VGDTPSRAAIVEFAEGERPEDVPPAGRVAVFDDGPTKPVRIWSRIGRRPILAVGNSNGDVPMLGWAGGESRSTLRLLVLHDDAEREFDYTAGAEQALETRRLRAGRS